MEYEERLTTLLHLSSDISQKVVHEMATTNDDGKLKEYNRQLQQIDKEVNRIQRIRGYRPDWDKLSNRPLHT